MITVGGTGGIGGANGRVVDDFLFRKLIGGSGELSDDDEDDGDVGGDGDDGGDGFDGDKT